MSFLYSCRLPIYCGTYLFTWIQLEFRDFIPVATLFAYNSLPEGFKIAMSQVITAHNNSTRFTAGEESNDQTVSQVLW